MSDLYCSAYSNVALYTQALVATQKAKRGLCITPKLCYFNISSEFQEKDVLRFHYHAIVVPCEHNESTVMKQYS